MTCKQKSHEDEKHFIFCFPICFYYGINAQNPSPETTGKRFIEAINESVETQPSGSDMFTARLEPKSAVILQDLHQRYAPMRFHHAEAKPSLSRAGMYLLHIYAQKNGAKMYTDFQILTDSHYKIEQIMFIAEVAEPISLPNSSIDDPYTLDWLDNYIKKLRNENDLSGSVLIAKGNHVFFERTYGFANASKTRQINNNTLYSLASGSKMFTAIAIMKLVEQGKLDVEDKITKYITGFSDQKKADQINIYHLLSHTSGVGEYWQGQKIPEIEGASSLAPHLEVVLRSGFAFDAGKDYQYCNSNYILLGSIIEKVSGMSYFDYVQKYIFDVAGMKNTKYGAFNEPDVAQHLARGSDDLTWIAQPTGKRGTSAGGALSTINDILIFSRALVEGNLIEKNLFERMVSPQNQPYGRGENYGYGFLLENHGGEFTFGHGGTANGTNFEYRYFTDQDITLVIFSNQNNGAYDDLKRNTIKLISSER